MHTNKQLHLFSLDWNYLMKSGPKFSTVVFVNGGYWKSCQIVGRSFINGVTGFPFIFYQWKHCVTIFLMAVLELFILVPTKYTLSHYVTYQAMIKWFYAKRSLTHLFLTHHVNVFWLNQHLKLFLSFVSFYQQIFLVTFCLIHLHLSMQILNKNS